MILGKAKASCAMKNKTDPVGSKFDGPADDNCASHVSRTLESCAGQAVKSRTWKTPALNMNQQDGCMQDVC